MFYGFMKYEIARGGSYRDTDASLPWNKSLRLGAVEVAIILLANWAIVISSFTTYNLVHCCSLLSVVLFAVLFSRVSDQNMQVGSSKVFIALLVCMGIFVFNQFTTASH